MMVTFDICAGNPGALQFLMQAYDMDMALLNGHTAPARQSCWTMPNAAERA